MADSADARFNPNGLAPEDRFGILDLYAAQSHRIDGGDAAGWAATFTDDGTFVSPTYKLTATGRDELEAFAASSNSAALARGDQLRHLMDNLVFEPAGPDQIRVQAYLIIFATSTAGSRVDRTVRVFDELARIDGHWLVRVRKVVRDG
jgi:hypothetical protein